MCGPTSPHSAMQLIAFCGVAAGIRGSLFSLSGTGTWRLGDHAETLWIDETTEVWAAQSDGGIRTRLRRPLKSTTVKRRLVTFVADYQNFVLETTQ